MYKLTPKAQSKSIPLLITYKVITPFGIWIYPYIFVNLYPIRAVSVGKIGTRGEATWLNKLEIKVDGGGQPSLVEQ